MMTILFLEDNLAELAHLKAMAQLVNPETIILTASRPAQASQLAANHVIDCFFLDMHLSDQTGLDFAVELRQMTTYQQTPIVFITSQPTRELIDYSHTHHIDYIVKTFEQQRLITALRRFLGEANDAVQALPIILTYRDYQIKLSTAEIIYLEGRLRHTLITTTDQCYDYHRRLASLIDQLPANFLRVGQSYIVNTDYIDNVNYKEEIILLAGHRVKISRNYKRKVREALNESV